MQVDGCEWVCSCVNVRSSPGMGARTHMRRTQHMGSNPGEASSHTHSPPLQLPLVLTRKVNQAPWAADDV
jgi:hypothetical protein